MLIKEINISKEYGIAGNARLITYIKEVTPETEKYSKDLDAMIVVPGGGYHFCSDREGEPIALEYVTYNYNSFVLYYDVAPARYPLSLTQLACSVDYIKKHADEFHINKDRVFVVGFSAGGHLTASLANFWHDLPKDYIGDRQLDCSVAGVVLSYPVITNDSHVGSFKNLLGIEDTNCAEADALSLEKTVNEHNPPCFIWTTATDKCVNPKATMLYTSAYLERNKPIECHVFPTGAHGGSTCDERVNTDSSQLVAARQWIALSYAFMQSLKK